MILALVALARAAEPAPATKPTAPAPAAGTPAAPAAPEPAAAPVGPDRSKPPPVLDPPVLPLAEPEVHELAPGVTAKFVRVPGIRKVAVDVILDAGVVDADGRGNPLAEGAGYLADAAAGPYGAAQLQELEDLKEIEVTSYLGSHQAGVNLQVPLDELPTGLELLTHVLREPTFPKAEVKRWKLDQELFYTVEGPSSQAALARAATTYTWFPADHPYGVRPDLDAVAKVSTDALVARWQRATTESPLSVIAVGDVEWSALEPALKAMVAGLGRPGSAPAELPFDAPSTSRVVVVDLPGQSQVAVRARWDAPAFGEADNAPMVVANYFLGGAFLSRLNLNLREEKGFTYGARTQYWQGRTHGMLTVVVDVKAENLGETITEIRKELHRLGAEPGTDDELTSARRAFAADWNRTLESADSAMGAYAAADDRGLTMAQWRARAESLQAVSLADVQAVTARWLGDAAPASWILVGDAKAIEAELAPFGLKAEVVTPGEAMLGSF
jgi:zinc protease